METSKINISRSDTDLVPVSKGELVVLLDQLNNLDNLVTIGLSCDFTKEIIRMAIDSFEDRKEMLDYEC